MNLTIGGDIALRCPRLREAAGETIAPLNAARTAQQKPSQQSRRGELHEPLTQGMPLKMGSRVTRPSAEKLF